MRHTGHIKEKVRELRRKGRSLDEIHKEVKVPKTTIRTWIPDIKLSSKQKNVFKERIFKALQEGRIRVQKIQKEKKAKREKMLTLKGKKDIGTLTQKEFFIAGVALYWAEGFKNKHEHRLGFCNSDPNMIKFYVNWLEKILGVNKKNVVARLTLNKAYEEKTRDIESYWSQTLGIPLHQFTKPFYQKTQWKKQYKGNNYRGVLRIHVKESLDHLLKMRGWIQALQRF